MELIWNPVYISRAIFCNEHEHFGTELMYVYKNKSAIYKLHLMVVSVS